VTGARRWAVRAAQLTLVAVIGFFVYRALATDLRGLSWQDVARWQPDIALLALSLILLLTVYIAHAFLWRRIMADLGIGRPSARSAIRIYFVSSLGRYLPGKLWQLAGIATLSGREGIPAAPAAASAVIGHLGFLTTGLLLLGALLPRRQIGGPAILAAAALLLVGSAAWILLTMKVGAPFRRGMVRRFGERLGPRLSGVFDLAERVRPRHAALWAAAYGATWIVLGIAFAIFTAAFVPAALGQTRQLGATVAASYLAGYLSFMPGGLGVRELTMAGMLTETASIPASASVLVAAASRLWFTAAELLPLLLVPALPAGAAGAPGERA